MQTFLPFPRFYESAASLDNKRLGKQRVEALQILRTLAHHSDGWRFHPAVKMWIGHELSLMRYTFEVCRVWTDRGYKDNVAEQVLSLTFEGPRFLHSGPPWWLGDPDFHLSHQSNLERKVPGTFPGVDPTLPYLWPCNDCGTFYPATSCPTHRGDRRQPKKPLDLMPLSQ